MISKSKKKMNQSYEWTNFLVVRIFFCIFILHAAMKKNGKNDEQLSFEL